MKRMAMALGLCGLVLAAGPRLAAADASLGGMGSYLDTDGLGEAWGGGLRLKYDLVEYLGFDLRGSFLRLGDPGISMFPVEANLMFQLPIKNILLPYGGMGVGYYFFDGGDIRLEDRVGYGPLAGLEIRLGNSVALFGEARWLYLEPKVSGGGSVKLDSFGINAGLMFLF
jgi:hypothetical protein